MSETAYERRVEALLTDIQRIGELNKLGVDEFVRNSKQGAEDARAAREIGQTNTRMLDELRSDVRGYEGKFSDIETKLDAVLGIVQEFKPVFEGTKDVFQFVRELRAGFAPIWERARQLLEREPHGVNVASVHPIRGSDQP